VHDVTDETFADEVLASAEAVIVDFWAPWCKPCDTIEPHLRALAEERGVRLVRLNIDENLAVPARFGVLALPTVILFEAGEPQAMVFGAHSRDHYERAFAPFLA
jgi:thioredoxin 1